MDAWLSAESHGHTKRRRSISLQQSSGTLASRDRRADPGDGVSRPTGAIHSTSASGSFPLGGSAAAPTHAFPSYPPETSAQGAAHSSLPRQHSPSTEGRDRQGIAPYTSLAGAVGVRSVDNATGSLRGTFGHSSQGSLGAEHEAARNLSWTVPRRRSTPTERSAFGSLLAEWSLPQTERLLDDPLGSDSDRRSQRIEALELELNLSPSPLQSEEAEELRESPPGTQARHNDALPRALSRHSGGGGTGGRGAGGGSSGGGDEGLRASKDSHASILTFGLSPISPSGSGSRYNSNSNSNSHSASAPSGETSSRDQRISRSETVDSRFSRETRPSDAGYGIGERGGDGNFDPLMRTVESQQTPEGHQRLGLPPHIVDELRSESTVRCKDRRSLSSPTTLRPTSKASSAGGRADTQNSDAPARPRSGLRPSWPNKLVAVGSRGPAATGSSMRGRAASTPDTHSWCAGTTAVEAAAPHGQLGGLRKLAFLADGGVRPAVLAGSSSVRTQTPVIHQSPNSLPEGQRASFIQASDVTSPGRVGRATGIGRLSMASARSLPDSWGRFDASLDLPSKGASLSMYHALQQRRKERFHFVQMQSTRPRFPSQRFSSWHDLRRRSVRSRIHHLLLPLLAFAHVPATLFLDFNAIFVLVQVALHPDANQAGVRTAWWVATGVYGACSVCWFVGVVVIYEVLWQYARRWTNERPLVLPIYLSAPARTITSIRSYTHYSLLYTAQATATTRDYATEAFWLYTQNWPTVLTLLPRGALCVVLLVVYRRSGPALTTVGARDPYFFEPSSGRLSTYAFVVLLVNAAWSAWRLGVLIVSWIGLLGLLGWSSIFERKKDGYDFGSVQAEKRLEGSTRHLFQSSYLNDHVTASDAQHDHPLPPYNWKLRAEDRIRTLLFDAGVDEATIRHDDGNQQPYPPVGEAGQHGPWSQLYQVEDHPPVSLTQVTKEQRLEALDGAAPVPAPMLPGIALTTAEAVSAPTMTDAAHTDRCDGDIVDDEKGDAVSDHFSPVPTPVGRTTRSREKLRAEMLAPTAASLWTSTPDSPLNEQQKRYADGTLPPTQRLAALQTTPSSALTSPGEPSPMEPSPRDSPILSGHRRIASTPSTDLHSIYAIVTSAGAGSPSALRFSWSRGQNRPRSSPSVVEELSDGAGQHDDERSSEQQHSTAEAEQRQAEPKPTMVVQRVEVPLTPAAFSRAATSIVLRQGRDRAKSEGDRFSGSFLTKEEQRKEKLEQERSLLQVRDQADSSSAHSSPNADGLSRSDTKHGGPASDPSPLGLCLVVPPPQQPSEGERRPASPRRSSQSFSRSHSMERPSKQEGGGGGGRDGPSPVIEDGSGGSGGSTSKASPLRSWGVLLPFSSSRNGQHRSPGDGGGSGQASPDGNRHERDEPEPAMRRRRDSWFSGFSAKEGSPRQTTGDGWWSSLLGRDTASPDRRTSGEAPAATPPESSSPRTAVKLSSPIVLESAPAAEAAARGPPSPNRSSHESSSSETDDSEEGRLWASFPDQSRRHPPGLIALNLEQQLAAASASATSLVRLAPGLVSSGKPSPPSITVHSRSSSGSLGGMAPSPSLGGLHAIREESMSSAHDSSVSEGEAREVIMTPSASRSQVAVEPPHQIDDEVENESQLTPKPAPENQA
ncbi:hypothetical protein ACQY0O_007516 [Thecaphora frezii]